MANILSKLRLVNPVLTEIMRGYQQSELIGPLLSPIVPVAQEEGSILQFGKDLFKSYNTDRAVGANSNVVMPETMELIPYTLTESDISYTIDYRQRIASVGMDLDIHGAEFTMSVLMLSLEKKIATLAQTPANYANSNKKALTT
ncbi:hypothetical protein MBAV_002095, partial [Candidatus Magnetobacterium bavaricum]